MKTINDERLSKGLPGLAGGALVAGLLLLGPVCADDLPSSAAPDPGAEATASETTPVAEAAAEPEVAVKIKLGTFGLESRKEFKPAAPGSLNNQNADADESTGDNASEASPPPQTAAAESVVTNPKRKRGLFGLFGGKKTSSSSREVADDPEDLDSGDFVHDDATVVSIGAVETGTDEAWDQPSQPEAPAKAKRGGFFRMFSPVDTASEAETIAIADPVVVVEETPNPEVGNDDGGGIVEIDSADEPPAEDAHPLINDVQISTTEKPKRGFFGLFAGNRRVGGPGAETISSESGDTAPLAVVKPVADGVAEPDPAAEVISIEEAVDTAKEAEMIATTAVEEAPNSEPGNNDGGGITEIDSADEPPVEDTNPLITDVTSSAAEKPKRGFFGLFAGNRRTRKIEVASTPPTVENLDPAPAEASIASPTIPENPPATETTLVAVGGLLPEPEMLASAPTPAASDPVALDSATATEPEMFERLAQNSGEPTDPVYSSGIELPTWNEENKTPEKKKGFFSMFARKDKAEVTGGSTFGIVGPHSASPMMMTPGALDDVGGYLPELPALDWSAEVFQSP